jgi:hypothetical protein
MTESEWEPLDPNEGPSVWAKYAESNNHMVVVAIGTDPENPLETFSLSHGEVENLNRLVQNRDN